MVAKRESDVAHLRQVEQFSSSSLSGMQAQNKSLEQKLQLLDSEYDKLR